MIVPAWEDPHLHADSVSSASGGLGKTEMGRVLSGPPAREPERSTFQRRSAASRIIESSSGSYLLRDRDVLQEKKKIYRL